MGTYCKNHVLERVDQYTNQAKNGEVTLRKTNGGTCGHLGGCNTNDLQKYDLRYEYQPSEADRAKAEAAEEEAKLNAEKEDAKQQAEKEADAKAKAEAEDVKQQAATSGSTDSAADTGTPEKTPQADAPPEPIPAS